MISVEWHYILENLVHQESEHDGVECQVIDERKKMEVA